MENSAPWARRRDMRAGREQLGKQRSNGANATVCDGRDVDTTCDWLTVSGSQAPGHRSGVFANVDGPVGCERESCGGVLEESARHVPAVEAPAV